jgi:hypothetical protein
MPHGKYEGKPGVQFRKLSCFGKVGKRNTELFDAIILAVKWENSVTLQYMLETQNLNLRKGYS